MPSVSASALPSSLALTPSETATTILQSSVPIPFLGSITITNQKRQSGGFVQNGNITEDCSTGSSLYLMNDQLFIDGLIVSTSPGVPYTPLAGSQTPGSITTAFSLINGILQWTNGGFPNGQTFFCLAEDQTLYAIFDVTKTPRGCKFTTVSAVLGSTCPGFQPIYPGPLGPQDKFMGQLRGPSY